MVLRSCVSTREITDSRVYSLSLRPTRPTCPMSMLSHHHNIAASKLFPRKGTDKPSSQRADGEVRGLSAPLSQPVAEPAMLWQAVLSSDASSRHQPWTKPFMGHPGHPLGANEGQVLQHWQRLQSSDMSGTWQLVLSQHPRLPKTLLPCKDLGFGVIREHGLYL